MLTFIEFGCGVGGMRIAMEKVGNRCVGWCDIEDFNQAAYRTLHETRNLWFHNDIRTLDHKSVPDTDCYCISCPDIGNYLIDLVAVRKPKFIIGEGNYLTRFRKETLKDMGYYLESEESHKEWNWEYTVCQRDTKFNIFPMNITEFISEKDDWQQKGFPDEMLNKLKNLKPYTNDGNYLFQALVRLTQINAFTEIAKKININLGALS